MEVKIDNNLTFKEHVESLKQVNRSTYWIFYSCNQNLKMSKISRENLQKLFNPLSANLTKWSKTMCLTILWGWRLKGYGKYNFSNTSEKFANLVTKFLKVKVGIVPKIMNGIFGNNSNNLCKNTKLSLKIPKAVICEIKCCPKLVQKYGPKFSKNMESGTPWKNVRNGR